MSRYCTVYNTKRKILKFDFSKSFEENVSDIVVLNRTKGMIQRYSDNYYVLLGLFNQQVYDNYNNKCVRPNGTIIHNTTQRCYDLRKKFEIDGIKAEWVYTKKGRKDYKRYYLDRSSKRG